MHVVAARTINYNVLVQASIVLLVCCVVAFGYTPVIPTHILNNLQAQHASSNPAPSTVFIEQTLDHFNFYEARSFSQRLLWNQKHWGTRAPLANGCKGPIFFYTGNEGDITVYVRAETRNQRRDIDTPIIHLLIH
jgi:hypothetical protein